MLSLKIDPVCTRMAADLLFGEDMEKKIDEGEMRSNGFSGNVETLIEWKKEARRVIDLLHKIDVKYVLIKALDVPYARMTDVDVLIEHPLELLDAAEALYKEGYQLFKFRLYNHPLKIAARKNDSPVSIDIYPEPSWVQLRSADRYFVTSCREKRVIHGVEAYIPKPWIDAYLIATHSYSHGRILLAEVLGALRTFLRKGEGMAEMLEQAAKWRMMHTMYIFLTLCAAFANDLDVTCLDALRTARTLKACPIVRIIDEWLKAEQPVSLPLKIPLNLRFKSATIRAIHLVKKGQTNAFGETITILLNELGNKVLAK